MTFVTADGTSARSLGKRPALARFENEALRKWSSLWDFNYPAVRATARHPTGGVVAIECLIDASPNVHVLLHHSIDDPIRMKRRSWSTELETRLSEDVMFATFDEALRLALIAPTAGRYSVSDISELNRGALETDAKYWSSFPTLALMRHITVPQILAARLKPSNRPVTLLITSRCDGQTHSRFDGLKATRSPFGIS